MGRLHACAAGRAVARGPGPPLVPHPPPLRRRQRPLSSCHHRSAALPGLQGPGPTGVIRMRPGTLRPDPAGAAELHHGTGELPAGGFRCHGLAALVPGTAHGSGGHPWCGDQCGAAQGGLLVEPPGQRNQQPTTETAQSVAGC